MQFDQSTPRANLTIGDNQFTVPACFVTGHSLSENEAKAMNQLLRENIRNNLAARLRDNGDGQVRGLTQEEVDEYVGEYEFGAGRGGGESRLSPVERKARQIAREKVISALKQKGKKIDTKTEEGKRNMEALVAQVAARPEIIKEAEKQLKSIEKIALEDLDIAA